MEVSLYGATAETYERVTRVPGSFERCIAGVRRLVQAGVRVCVKAILMTLNHHEFGAMRDLAKAWGCTFRFGGELFPTFDGDAAPLRYRLSPEVLAQCDRSDPDLTASWQRSARDYRAPAASDPLYTCGAGRSGFFVTSSGMLLPCMTVRHTTYDLRDGDFATGWRDAMPDLWKITPPQVYACRTCNAAAYCRCCSSKMALESGTEGKSAPFHCELARARKRFLDQPESSAPKN